MEKKKQRGRPFTGGRNPANWNKDNWKKPVRKTPYKTTSIAGSPEEIQSLKDKARSANKTVSRFVLDSLLYGENKDE